MLFKIIYFYSLFCVLFSDIKTSVPFSLSVSQSLPLSVPLLAIRVLFFPSVLIYVSYYLCKSEFKKGAYFLLPTSYCLLFTAYCLLPTVYCLLFTAYCLLLTAYFLLLTAYCLLLRPSVSKLKCRLSLLSHKFYS